MESVRREVQPPLKGDNVPHVVLVGTKPDIIKQAPIYLELRRRGHRAVLCHTGQHYDHNLSAAMLDEFGISATVNLGIQGDASQLAAGITLGFSTYLGELQERSGPPVVYVHGDTSTAMAGALAAFTGGHRLVHVEAGLRTLSPRKSVLDEWLGLAPKGELQWTEYAVQSCDPATYERGSREPSPEQFNTRVADAASHLHAVPVELNRQFLLSEGFSDQSIHVVGNSIVDAVDASASGASQRRLLDRFPQLASGGFIRICVHRKENTESRDRFEALMDALEALLEHGHSVLFIRLGGTESAIDRFDRRGWLHGLRKRFGARFITTGVWDDYSEVVEAMKMCALVATDSGSIQEELNVLGVPCVTLRFGSDRGESLLSGGNFLAPPVSGGVVSEIIGLVFRNRGAVIPNSIYLAGASKMLVDAVETGLATPGGLTYAEEWRYGLV